MLQDDVNAFKFIIKTAIGIVLCVILIVVSFQLAQPIYSVWEQKLVGEGELARANYNRQVLVKEAEAKLEASKSLALAEIERARGVAEANKIIGVSLKGNEEYLHYLWIHNLAEGKNEVIYVPTEANLPILEANRKNK